LEAFPVSNGLEGIVAAETIISHVDGEKGVVWVRGHDIGELVADYGYEATVALLWDSFTGENLTRNAIREQLGQARAAAFRELHTWLRPAVKRPLVEGIRMALAAMPENSVPTTIIGSLTVAIASLLRARAGELAVEPNGQLTTAADLLRMTRGAEVEDRIVAALDSYLTTVIDNGLGASTFAARVIASTEASLASAVLGAYGAFTGKRHGGAPVLALDMLDAITASGDIDGWLESTLAQGGRLMGFGHRVFRVRDPRGDILRTALVRLNPNSPRLAAAGKVERRAAAILQRRKPDRKLQANMEMDAALLLEEIGVPRDAFTPVFALGRAPSWIAHALEQQKSGRMIRPQSSYIGPKPPV
jgi:citrate synthase